MAKLILAIDDDKLMHHIIEESLAGFCKVIHAKNGEDGIRQAIKYNPDIILLDVEMPGMSGYEVCQTIKQNKATTDIPVMFLSSKVGQAERIKGFSVGGADYILKPFNAQELMARIKILYQYRKQCATLQYDIAKANKTAEMAMIETGDMGRIMRFVCQSYHADNLELLSEYFLGFFTPLHLNVVVVFWQNNQGMFYSQETGVCPLEQELLIQHKNAERFVDIGHSTIINYPNISLLIKNMPVDTPSLYGRYKDLFPHILEVTNEKVVTIQQHQYRLMRDNELTLAFKDIVAQLKNQNAMQTSAISQLTEQLEQLQSLIQTHNEIPASQFNEQITQLSHTSQQLVATTNDLAFIKHQLKTTTQQRDDLITQTQLSKQQTQPEPESENNDIELF